MKAFPVLAAALCVGASAHARPVFLEETARIANPDPSYLFGSGVGLDGDHAIVLGYKSIPDPDGVQDTQRTVFLFRLVGGTWTYVRQLGSDIESNEMDGPEAAGVDLAAGVAGLALAPFRILEREGADYVQKLAPFGLRTEHVQIEGNRVLFGSDCWGGSVYARNASGAWAAEGHLRGDDCGSTDGATGGPVALSDPWAAVANPWNFDDELPGPSVSLFQRTRVAPNAWEPWQLLVVEPGHYAGKVAFQDFRLFVEDFPQYGTTIYERNDVNEWQLSLRRLATTSQWMTGSNSPGSPYRLENSLEASPDYVMRHAYDWDRDDYVIHVFQYGLNEYLHVATLVPGDGGFFTGQISISGRRVLVAGWGHAYYYELPESLASPAVRQDTFPGTSAPGWTTLPGSRFSIAQRSDSRVFRQSDTSGEAGAIFDAADWSNQAIQADVRPRALAGNDRWFGLFTRRSDSSNYYYVTLRSSGQLQLKRMVNGSFSTLASMSVGFALHRNYRLRLESIGSLHRVYLDGDRLLEARDDTLTSGRAGVLSYRVAADYDNVVVSPAPAATSFERNEGSTCVPACVNPRPWKYGGGQWVWTFDGQNSIFRQSSLTDWARVYAGERPESPDLVVEARARLRAFGEGNDPWFGVIAGAGGDASGYTYLALRRSNTVTLRKVINGQITQLGTAVFNVTRGAWYRLRLEIVGERVRGYVNGRLVLEAVDDQPLTGAGGLVTYHTQADFDDFRAVQP